MRKAVGAVAVLSVLLTAGCATLKAPLQPNGQKINLFLLVNRGDPAAMQENQWKYRNEVGEYMESDLIRRLTELGYSVRQIQNRNEFTAGEGNYLFSIAITSYYPGVIAGAPIGMSAIGQWGGGAKLITHYELYGADVAALTSSDAKPRSEHGWRGCVRENNTVTIKGVTVRLRAIYPAAPGQ